MTPDPKSTRPERPWERPLRAVDFRADPTAPSKVRRYHKTAYLYAGSLREFSRRAAYFMGPLPPPPRIDAEERVVLVRGWLAEWKARRTGAVVPVLDDDDPEDV
jgi:hypothetical protein